jgi:hypothetical protein
MIRLYHVWNLTCIETNDMGSAGQPLLFFLKSSLKRSPLNQRLKLCFGHRAEQQVHCMKTIYIIQVPLYSWEPLPPVECGHNPKLEVVATPGRIYFLKIF